MPPKKNKLQAEQALQFRCVKTGQTFPFGLNFFNNPEANSASYSNIVLEWGYKVEWFKSLVPFKKLQISYGAQNSPLVESKSLGREIGLDNFVIKDESHNPYWTHKDRRSEFIVNVALEQWVDKIVCLTAWNAWYSLSRYCARAGIDYTSLVFPWVSKERKASLWERWNVITIDWSRYNGILRPRDFKQIVEEYDKYERKKEWNNTRAVTNSFEPISVNAYKELFYEVAHLNPDYIAIPCWSWDIIIGIWLAIKELWMATKIITAWPKWEHPLRYAVSYGVEEFLVQDYKENSLAEKLTSPFTAVLPILYKIFSEPGNYYVEVDNECIGNAKKMLEDCWIKAEYSAAASVSAFISMNRPDIDPKSRIVIVSTGKWLEN